MRGAILLALLGLSAPAQAGIKDYQVRRLLMLKTECQVSGLTVGPYGEGVAVEGGQSRFLATCENVSHYPDGVEILCPQTEDDRECRILTAKREFRHLRGLER